MPKVIPIRVIKYLIPKIETNNCKIYCSDGGYGTGFFVLFHMARIL